MKTPSVYNKIFLTAQKHCSILSVTLLDELPLRAIPKAGFFYEKKRGSSAVGIRPEPKLLKIFPVLWLEEVNPPIGFTPTMLFNHSTSQVLVNRRVLVRHITLGFKKQQKSFSMRSLLRIRTNRQVGL